MTTLQGGEPGTAPAGVESRLRDLEAQMAGLARTRGPSNGLTIIAFGNDQDRLLAAFVLANGAAAMGTPVTMFFTFWALAVLKRRAVFRGKSLIGKLLTAMLPVGPRRLGMSKWNMLGFGPRVFDAIRRRGRMESLHDLVAVSRELNVRLVACETAMEVMAVTRDELIEGVEFGGVASCIDAALDGSITLFI